MDLAIFSTKPYDRRFLEAANEAPGHALRFYESRLDPDTATLAAGHAGVCPFVNDDLSRPTLEILAAGGTRLIALRSAGYNHVDLAAAGELGLTVARVPAYSPRAVAEHALALMLTLNRKTHRAYNRVRDGNFALEGLLGMDLFGRTAGIVGTGKIGQAMAQILSGFGMTLVAFDPYPSDHLARVVDYIPLDELLERSDVVTLHCPLTPETRHLIDGSALKKMKPGVMLINTSRGALIDTVAVIEALKRGTIGQLGLDVYEEEGPLFFEDRSNLVIQDDVFSRLLTFPNVLITGHQGFFTVEALTNIARTTLANVTAFENGTGELHEVRA